jgi:hypothetical protein
MHPGRLRSLDEVPTSLGKQLCLTHSGGIS